MKTAIIHEWLVNYAGSERVLEQIIKLYPDADLFCQVDFLSDEEKWFILNKPVITSFIRKLPWAKTRYRSYLPLMPFAVRQFDVSGYDLIISNSHSVAKGIRKKTKQLQICYCHTPMRYVWDLESQYLKEAGLDSGVKGVVVKAILNRIRKWDLATSGQVNYFIANSYYIKDRIKRSYGRDATVIYPPVDTDGFQINDKKDTFFLAVSRMVPYKKMDLIVEAFSEIGLPLVVIGHGPDFKKVKRKAKKNVEFLGYQNDVVLKKYMQKARALVFAAEEDFGIIPVEAQACGTPVIAFGKGGATETVVPIQSSESGIAEAQNIDKQAPTGVFFYKQTTSAIIDATKKFMSIEDKFNLFETRKNAEKFSIERFKREFKNFVNDKVEEFF